MRSIPPALRLALAGVALAGVFLGWSILHAVNPDVVQPSGSNAVPAVVSLEPRTPGRAALISSAVDRDPFNPARTRPAVRYRLAHEMAEVAAPQRRQPMRWVGVVIWPDNPASNRLSVALGTNQNAPVQSLKVGDKISEYTLMEFDYKAARFQSESGEMIMITTPRKGIR
jgi:hypothetical protein